MVVEVLVETGFLLALNPRDKNHGWALEVLEDGRRRRVLLYLSPAAPLELSLIMKSRGIGDEGVSRALRAIDAAIRGYTVPRYAPLEIMHMAYAAELRARYPELTFFDSLHTSMAILNNLVYYDLDDKVREVVEMELRSS